MGRGWRLAVTVALAFSVLAPIQAEAATREAAPRQAAPRDVTPPTVPGALRATAVGPARVQLTWTASRDARGVTAYDVIRDGRWVVSRAVPSYADVRVLAARRYRYQVRARDAAGNASRLSNAVTVTTPRAPSTISFGAAGDHGANAATEGSLNALDASGVNFYLALGDLDYRETGTAAAWCTFVSSRLPTLGARFPFQLVSGNHEESYVQQHAACLPDRLGSTLGPQRQYAAEYYFDYPAGAPLVRVVMISPALTINGHRYSYAAGSEHYRWVAAAIDNARSRGVPWVVVGMHKNCISAGGHGCSIGADLMNLLIAKRVDLVLQGHVHGYQRGKQLALNPMACPALRAGAFDAGCVVDSGADGHYVKGRGAVTLIVGVFGKGGSNVDTTDPEAGYFAKASSAAGGFMKFTLSKARLDARFVRGRGTFTDAFSIVR